MAYESQAQRGEGYGQHGGGGGLAVRAGHRDGPQAVHQGGQGVRAVDDRDGQLVRPEQLRVVGADGAGDDHAGRVLGQMRGRVPDVHGRPQRPQGLGGGGLLGVAARHLRSALGEDLRDARHSGAADADEVRSFHGGGNAGCHLYSCGGVGERAPRGPVPLQAAALSLFAVREELEHQGRPPCAGRGRPSRGGRTPPRSAGAVRTMTSSAPASSTTVFSLSRGWSSTTCPTASAPAWRRARREYSRPISAGSRASLPSGSSPSRTASFSSPIATSSIARSRTSAWSPRGCNRTTNEIRSSPWSVVTKSTSSAVSGFSIIKTLVNTTGALPLLRLVDRRLDRRRSFAETILPRASTGLQSKCAQPKLSGTVNSANCQSDGTERRGNRPLPAAMPGKNVPARRPRAAMR